MSGVLGGVLGRFALCPYMISLYFGLRLIGLGVYLSQTSIIKVIKGDTRSLDYSSCGAACLLQEG